MKLVCRCGVSSGSASWKHTLTILVLLYSISIVFLSCSSSDNTVGSDTKAPRIVSTIPESHSKGVSVSAPIQVEFSEDMDSTSFGTNRIVMNRGVTGTIDYRDSTATFTPSEDLDWETEYAVTVYRELRDLASNTLGADYNWYFTTEAATPGVVWNTVSNGMSAHWEAVTYNLGVFVAVGDNSLWGPAVITSFDGRNWQPKSFDVSNPGGTILNDVAANGNIWVAVGNGGVISTSPDALFWTLRSEGQFQPLLGITWSGELFVAVGTRGTVVSSNNGIVWTEQFSGTEFGLLDVAWSGDLYVATGINVVLTSPDAVTWTEYFIGPETFNSLIWVNDRFYAVGGGIFTSVDGETWVKVFDEVNLTLNDIDWSGERFVAVGQGQVYYSEDATDWHQAQVGISTLSGVDGSDSVFVAVGGTGLSGGVILISD